MLARLWRHVEYNWKQGGIGQVCRKALWRVGQWAWSEESWLTYRLELADYGAKPALRLEERELSYEDLRGLGYYKALAFPEMLREWLAAGHVCNGFLAGGALANLGWTSVGYLELEPGLDIAEPGCAAIFDCYTVPEQRGKGIYTDALIRMIGKLQSGGARVALIAVDPRNRASIRAIERVGFLPHRRIVRLRRFGRRIRIECVFDAATDRAVTTA